MRDEVQKTESPSAQKSSSVRLILQRGEDAAVFLQRHCVYKEDDTDPNTLEFGKHWYWAPFELTGLRRIGHETLAEAICRYSFRKYGLWVHRLRLIHRTEHPSWCVWYVWVPNWSGQLPDLDHPSDRETSGMYSWVEPHCIPYYVHHPEVDTALRKWARYRQEQKGR